MAHTFIATAVLAFAGAASAGECYTSTNVDSLTLSRGPGRFKAGEFIMQFSNDYQYNQQLCKWVANSKERHTITEKL
ncbi:hypothetical protein AURDEDRAFT_160590 [Auricularia subglabra TFB-10046 SS5]|nr:hypothetical protein AURDEDRAFT_160590 [Auricularia subglabra TFB-10046 SS5]